MPRPRKQFGQHWLRSDRALTQIIKTAELSAQDRVLEIGPGTGILTRVLLPLVRSLLAVEIDRDLCRTLTEKLAGINNFLLLQGDFLELDLASALDGNTDFYPPNKVVANIPYNITGPILEKLLGTIAKPAAAPLDLIVLLVQQEVAQRLVATPKHKAFGALSVRVQFLADCQLVATVPAKAFYPPPQVDSAIVKLRPHRQPKRVENPTQLDTLVRMGFATRRKMLRNNLKGVVERDRLAHLLEQLKLNSQVRAEELSVEQWISLSNMLGSVLSDEKLDAQDFAEHPGVSNPSTSLTHTEVEH
jgi:16S rRNA (adenine1518-N6/adenine1519-N6)-dimethyltransferase